MKGRGLVLMAMATLLSLDARPGTVYSEEGTTLVATVDAAETNEFDSTYADALNANTYTAFEKHGDGGLFMPNDLSGYMGTVTVRAGSLGYRKSTSLGSLAAGNGDVEVIAGATLFIPNDSGLANTVSPLGKSFRLAGLGVNGAGAVDIRSEQQYCPMGTNITLTADARVRNRTQYFWGNGWSSATHRCRLDMGGYTLRLYSEGSSPVFKMVDVVNPGHIEEENEGLDIGESNLGGSAANEFRLVNTSSNKKMVLQSSSDYQRPWTLVAGYGMGIRTLSPSYDAIYNPYPGITTNYNTWNGPVVLRGAKQFNVQSSTTSHGGIAFLGKVTGAAPLRHADGATFSAPVTTGVRLWNPGAIGNPSVVKLEEGEVAFDNLCDDFGALPDLNANCGLGTWVGHVSLMYTNEVRFGRGEWKSVTKTGDERLWWYSGTGAKELNIAGGFLKLPRRAKIAGLYSAQTNSYDSGDIKRLFTSGSQGAGWCRQRDLEPGVRAPNCETHAYNNYNYKLNPSKSGDAQWSTVIYSGYVWNNSPTNETWGFAGGGGRCYRLTVGDTVVYDIDRSNGNNVDASVLGHGTAVLKPGPNFFELANYRVYKQDGKVTYNANWKNAIFNFGYNPSGLDTGVQSDYRRMEDPGDGSLFTFCLPGEEIVYPRHAGETHTSTQPDFAHITFADGTGLDLEGVTNYVAASFTGWPIVTNATCFAVTNTWTIPAADLVAGTRRMVSDGRIDLSQATIRFDNAALLPAHDESFHEVCVAAGGITGVPRVATGVKARWGARIAGGGCTLELFRVPAGMHVSFR